MSHDAMLSNLMIYWCPQLRSSFKKFWTIWCCNIFNMKVKNLLSWKSNILIICMSSSWVNWPIKYMKTSDVTGGMPCPYGSVVRSHDLLVVSLIPGWDKLCFWLFFCLSTLLNQVRKVVGGFAKKVVLVLVEERQETHVSWTTMIDDLNC